ncbi:CDP-glycerol glycerophosphotransferase family protein [Fictibacillus fluitans]|uniref:CDP-glycerol glycerophosphotransferase family protein n=1 Tax=Fictibacillus fluitans TaxID=3058422 RepID=A0ABT8HZC0_9BACL|nr:CDP-glycerol glycerophosphotransferase family protein [Fictibacillus sp. NE201]MDN4526088.1 CDP-glycerol glycerophosphotransferase family protein [Fictibacillus sp. NE201]
MITRVKRKLRRVLGRNKIQQEQVPDQDLIINDRHVIIRKDRLEPTLPLIKEMAGVRDNLVPRRKVTHLSFTGPVMKIKGYYYLEDIPIHDDDYVKKRLILVNMATKKNLPDIHIPLQDIKIDGLHSNENISDDYKWSGFQGEINFSRIELGNKPLIDSEYTFFIEIEMNVPGQDIVRKKFPLGNIESYLPNGFYSAKMEYFSARRHLKYNLLATYDQEVKTLKLVSSKLKDFDPAELDMDEAIKRTPFYRFFYSKVFKQIYNFCCLFPVKEKKVLFASDSREDMSGNFQFVYEEMLKRDLDFDYHFMLKKGVGVKKSFGELTRLAYDMATSKYIVLDDFYPLVYPLKIRDNAELVQLWHAVGAFKTFGFSRLGRPGGPSPKSLNHRNYTKAIVSSHNIGKYYAEGFGISEEHVVPTGIPRTDVFFDEVYQHEVKERLYEEFPFLRDKKVITFAPTFRGNGQQSAHYNMEMLNLDKIYEELKDEYVFLFKVHPFVKNDFSIPYQYSEFFYDFSSYREINDLLFVTDILITDYSSVCFEYALLNKPMIFFAYDVEEYIQKRDFYFDYHSFIPGPLVKTTDQLVSTIKREDFKMEKVQPFVKYFFDDIDGKASERVVDRIFLGIGEEDEEEHQS